MHDAYILPHLLALIVMALLFVFFCRVGAGTWRPAALFAGTDKRPSTSKFQFLIWTIVVLYSYLVIYAARALSGYFEAIDRIPPNLLTAMGLSVVTAAAAKGITVGYLQTGRTAKPEPAETKPNPADPAKSLADLNKPREERAGWSFLVTEDDGKPDLSKIQMIVWTFVAVGIYSIGLCAAVQDMKQVLGAIPANQGGRLTKTYLKDHPEIEDRISLPDISAALMVLMGLGQGAYLGKKLVSADNVRLTQLTPAAGKPGIEVAINGVAFSDAADGNQITINGKPEPSPCAGKDSQIKFRFPPTQPDGKPWPAGDVVRIGVITGGQDSANTLPFTVSIVPDLARLAPVSGKRSDTVTLTGSSFGPAPATSRVLLNGVAIVPTSWSETEIKFVLPADHTPGTYQVTVEVAGQPSKALALTVTA